VGPDGGSDTFLGQNIGAKTSSVSECVNGTQFPNFQGTSAATPHVAAVAALLLEADPSLTVDQLYTILQQSTLSMGVSPNVAGAGFIQADIAATKTPAVIPPAPVLTLASTSIAVGASTTLTWTSSNNQGCTASGTWTGAQASNGQLTISPTAVGSQTYTLMCTNVAGTSQADSVTLTVTAAASSGGGGHGGGSIDGELLLALSGLLVGRALIARRTRNHSPRAS
jgi:subtilisin family serine protease